MNRYIMIAIFVVFAAQVYVPASLIFRNDDVLANGTRYKLRTAPFDPIDPLRGKYVRLSFDIHEYDIRDTSWGWKGNEETVYVVLRTDEEGFGVIDTLLREVPDGDVDYIKAKATGWGQRVHLSYTFERFYMEESKAYPAERLYWDARADREKLVYAEVFVKNGRGALNEVFIDDIPLKEAVEQYMDTVSVE